MIKFIYSDFKLFINNKNKELLEAVKAAIFYQPNGKRFIGFWTKELIDRQGTPGLNDAERRRLKRSYSRLGEMEGCDDGHKDFWRVIKPEKNKEKILRVGETLTVSGLAVYYLLVTLSY